MKAQALVHHLVASKLHIAEAAIQNSSRFDQLGLRPLDLVLVVLQFESLDRGEGSFPVAALNQARTVGDLVGLVDRWVQGGPAA